MKNIYFIIPVYNVEKYLLRCINSVLSQTYPGCKAVLVDDGSPDRCPAICDEYAGKYANIHVIHKENGGLADTRNTGIEYVLTCSDDDDYIAFLDPDDFISDDFTEIMIGLCEMNSCPIAQCGYEKGSSGSFTKCEKIPKTFVSDAKDALLGYNLKSMCCAKVYKVSCLRELRFKTGVINEDEFFTYRAVYSAGNAAFTDDKLYYYFQHDKSIMSCIAKHFKNNPHRFDFLEAYKERIEFFEAKNAPALAQRTYEKICTDILLRYTEQMRLPYDERDKECTDGTYMKMYRENFRLMIKRKGIPLKRRAIYNLFYILPRTLVLLSRVLQFRK